MDNLLFSLNVVAPLFVLMGLGYVLRLIKFVSEDFLGQLNKFVFKLCLPLMLFEDIRHSFHGEITNSKLILCAFIGIMVVILLSVLIVPLFIKRKGQQGSMIQGIYRSNFLIYGLPLAVGMYGDAARAEISMLMGIMIPVYNVAAVIILTFFSETGDKRISVKNILKDIVTNPLIIGCAFGMLAGWSHLELPRFLDTPVSLLAGTGAP